MYSRKVDEREYTFGVSGRLYKSNVLLYDHQTESLWSQLMQRAVSGPLVGQKLQKIPSIRVGWQTWRKRNTDTLVLSDNTGYNRDYSIDPYKGYYQVAGIMFPVGDVRQDLAAKDRVLGIEVKQAAKAYPLEWLRANPGTLRDQLAGESIEIQVDPDGQVVSVLNQSGEPIDATFAYWFAWQAFHPATQVFTSPP